MSFIDRRFFHFKGPFTAGDLAKKLDLKMMQGADDVLLSGAAPLESAGAGDVTSFHNVRYKPLLPDVRASVVLMPAAHASCVPKGVGVMATEQPLKDMTRLLNVMYEEKKPCNTFDLVQGAHIAPSANIGKDSTVGVGAVIGAQVCIGDRCVIETGAVLGDHVVLGDDCYVGSHASVSYAVLGDRVNIKAGARIGQTGFGFFANETNAEERLHKLQLGRVLIENDVDIGANTTVDRGSLRDTIIGSFTRIDNLVQIAHNVVLGKGVVIAAQVGISGSTTVKDGVMLGGQAGLAGHLTVGSHAKVAAQSGVMRSVPDGAYVAGSPAVKGLTWHRQNVQLAKLALGGLRQIKKGPTYGG